VQIGTTGSNVAIYQDTTGVCGTTYYYRVRGYNGGFNSDYSNKATGNTNPCTPPNAFDKVNPTNGATNQSLTPILSWQATSPVTRYEYCYDATINNSCSNWTDNGTSTSVTLPTLSNSTAYEWHVRAYNSSAGPTYSNGSSTAFWSFTTQAAPPTPPNAFNKVSPTDDATNQSLTPMLTWQATSPVTRYEYCYDATINFSCSNWIDNGMSTSVTLPTLSYSTTYEWHVRAYNNAAGPTYSNGSSTFFWSFTTRNETVHKIFLALVLKNP
jgi:hypothetical protein